jgi:hypothetical protein
VFARIPNLSTFEDIMKLVAEVLDSNNIQMEVEHWDRIPTIISDLFSHQHAHKAAKEALMIEKAQLLALTQTMMVRVAEGVHFQDEVERALLTLGGKLSTMVGMRARVLSRIQDSMGLKDMPQELAAVVQGMMNMQEAPKGRRRPAEATQEVHHHLRRPRRCLQRCGPRRRMLPRHDRRLCW